MTALATGAAATPPVVSLPLTPPFSMITATAIFGMPLTHGEADEPRVRRLSCRRS